MDRNISLMTEKIADFIALRDGDGEMESRFEALALEVFDCQYHLMEPYRELCRLHGRTPQNVKSWTEIPAVPADAFKHFFLFAGDPSEVVKTSKSSGTTQPGSSSEAHFSQMGLELMNLSIETNGRRMLFPDTSRTRILVLAPNPELAPHMIMVHGMNHLLERFGAEGSRFCIGRAGLDVESFLAELKLCCERNIPVTLMGSSFGFVHLFDQMEGLGLKLPLPQGSRLMDAGGYKGRSREIDRDTFVQWVGSMLGLPPERVVNLLGMTEMASQIYDGILDRSLAPAGESVLRMKEPPHWVRTQLRNPAQLGDGDIQDVTESGTPGLLRHFDLANVERPMVIQSEDIGIRRGSGFDVLKRAKGAEPRGCSLTMEEFTARGA